MSDKKLRMLLVFIALILPISGFAAPQVQATIDKCIQQNKNNPDRYPGCYNGVIDQVVNQTKNQMKQKFPDSLNQNNSGLAKPGVSTPAKPPSAAPILAPATKTTSNDESGNTQNASQQSEQKDKQVHIRYY